MGKKLNKPFFARMTVSVAQDLLGKTLVFGKHRGLIIETEAYRGQDDEASHAYRGRTKRASIMYGPPGMSYVYLIYGMYHCLNVVTEVVDDPGAVLIRGIKLLTPPYTLLDGPGKLCRALDISRLHNNIDLTCNKDFYLEDGLKNPTFEITPRVGIRVATDKMWRFTLCEG